MDRIEKMIFLLMVSFFMACGNSSSESTVEEESPFVETPVDEDDLIMRLSLELMANPRSLAEEEQNAIINYAMDEMLDIHRASSGVYYQILKKGEGDHLKWADQISVHYRGYFLDGQEFDSSHRRNKPMKFYIGNMIPGWNEGLQLLQAGSKARLIVPSHLGYGEEGLKDGEDYLVPPNRVLVFEVEVLRKLS